MEKKNAICKYREKKMQYASIEVKYASIICSKHEALPLPVSAIFISCYNWVYAEKKKI